MKKIKDLWINNKVMIMLGLILVCCLLAICIVMFSYFLGGTYEEKEDYNFDKSNYITVLESEKNVDSSSTFVKGNTIYITIKFIDDTSLDDAKSIALKSLEYIDEDALKNCDISFTLKSDKTDASDGYVIMGAKNMGGSTLEWNNNTPVESDEE